MERAASSIPVAVGARRVLRGALFSSLSVSLSVLMISLASSGAAQPASQADVVRFLEQATFGPTPALVAHVQAVGFEAYLQEQAAAPTSRYPSLPEQPENAKVGCPTG